MDPYEGRIIESLLYIYVYTYKHTFFKPDVTKDFFPSLASDSLLLIRLLCTFRYCGEHEENEPNNFESSVSSVSSPAIS